MKPPYCFLCHQPFGANQGGGLVVFADYQPLEEGVLGHARGWEWFCPAHLPAAEALAHQTSVEALHDLQRVFGAFPQPVYLQPPISQRSVLLLFPQLQKIIDLVRHVTGRALPKDK